MGTRVAARGSSLTIRTQSKKMAMLIRGEMSVKDMDDEELVRMQFRDRNGKFTGRAPAVVPHELAAAAQKELLSRGQHLFEGHFLRAIQGLADLAANAVDESVKLKAQAMIVERVMGKTPDKVEISGEAPWQVILNRVIVRDADGSVRSAPVVVPGEVVNVSSDEES